jgi:type III secretion protein W
MSEFQDMNIQRSSISKDIVDEAAWSQMIQSDEEKFQGKQILSHNALQDATQDTVNPFVKMQKDQKTLSNNKSRLQKMLRSGEPRRLDPIDQIKDSASRFQESNPELKETSLIRLRQLIKDTDTAEEILNKVKDFYTDVSLMDEALDFLLSTSEGELAAKIQEAKELLNERSGREIIAGRNIGAHAREAAEKGLGSPTTLRDMYRNITGNPRDSATLFQELSQRYAFKDLKKVIDFLLHSLGADLKAKGTSIPRGQLHRLFTETRSLQAILGVYRFFRGRMALMAKLFEKDGLEMPSQLTFEAMAKQFMGLAGERYPTGDKVLQTAVKLGLEKWILAKIIALSQFRDAIREVAVYQIYRSIQHRDELYLAILEALEELEDELEELLDKQEEEEGGEGEEESEEQEEEKQKEGHVT